MSDYKLLLETGDRLLLETGDFLLLDPSVVLGDLTFLPDYPSTVPHMAIPRETTWATSAAVFSPRTNPPADILAALTFFPRYPDRVPHRRTPIHTASVDTAAWAIAAGGGSLWWPVYPDQVPSRRLSTALRSLAVAAPSADAQVVAAQLGWTATYPERVARHRALQPAGAFWTIPPFVPAAGTPCVDWGRDHLTFTTFTSEAVALSSMIAEGVVFTTLAGEDVC